MSSIRDIMNAEDQAVDTKDAGPAVSSSFSSSSLSLASRINNNRNTSNNINDSIDTSTSDDNKNSSSTGNSGHQQKQFHGILSQSQLPSHHHNLYHTSSSPSSSTASNTASNTTTAAAATNYHLPLRPHAPPLHYRSSPHLSASVSASATTSTTSCRRSTTPLPHPPSLPSSGQQSPVFSGGSFPHKDSPSVSASSAMDSFHRQSRHNSPSGPPFAPSGPPSSFTSSPRTSHPSQIGAQEVKLTPVTGRVSRAKRGIPVHYCQECNKTFTRAEHLRRHSLSHGRPEFPCPFPGCSREFHRKDLLERHRQKHHNDSETDPVVAYPYPNPSHLSSANPGSSGSAPSRCPSAGSLSGLGSSPGAVFYQSQNLSVPGAAPNQQQSLPHQQHQHQHQQQQQQQHQHQHQQQPGHPQHKQHTAIHGAAEFPWGRTRSSSMNHAISSTAQNVNVFYPQFPLTGQYPEFHGMEGSNSGSSHAPPQTTGQVGGSGMDVNIPSGHINIVSSQMHTPEPMYSHSYDASFSMPLDFAGLDFFHPYGGQQQQQQQQQQQNDSSQQ
ncbi:hypothetical protein CFIMG_001369RA [Ceratocystis fimbriata CBS 114723]|uniref:C2H2-type domain-containing protein n=1 Tax=Ceratocystis fimbriata CBS 114723 TaxID=1035309 RepID=A0A2C5XHC4_9PEZI|nr:hypothetical protein CFIMG_001369RA [Ceratocystis fimbriata CBS 114723]